MKTYKYSCETLLYSGNMIVEDPYVDDDGWVNEENIRFEFEDVAITEQKLRNSIFNKNAGKIKGDITFEILFPEEAVYKVKFDLIPSQTIINMIEEFPGQPDFFLDGLSSHGPDIVAHPGDDSLEVTVVEQCLGFKPDNCKQIWSRSCNP
jgi:hypothetical protein